MAYRRYGRDKLIRGGKCIGTNQTIRLLRTAMVGGSIKFTVYTTIEGDRLDQIAAQRLGSSKYWWILAILSGIGWNLQIPPGTRIIIPTNPEQIQRFTG